MMMQKIASKPRHEIRRAQDNGPTVERAEKADYESVPEGKKMVRRKRSILTTLENSGRIDGSVVTIANRWYHDYVFSQSGVLEIDADLLDGYVRGDVHTFAIARGKAGERISLVRSMLTENEHRWLVFLLVREFSMSELGGSLWPEMCRSQQIARCERQAEIVIMKLASAYMAAKKAQVDAPPRSTFPQRKKIALDYMRHKIQDYPKSNTYA
ncbi:hypothetical protein K6W36_12350 [Acetobacter senegalensis]|uniref:hypothetical protein n=1 Tax=Acetobacter senegalensis TaxID=446692 RepID=UPI001EDA5052|nr:hypothetical protein [Acetobacter senegalensis]MCG4261356.1 hypothetical protein [Acetobacter senegalensis]